MGGASPKSDPDLKTGSAAVHLGASTDRHRRKQKEHVFAGPLKGHQTKNHSGSSAWAADIDGWAKLLQGNRFGRGGFLALGLFLQSGAQ